MKQQRTNSEALIIAVLNHKGGVGKTSSVANIGEALSRKGKRVLLIDLDAQANLTSLFASRMEEEIGKGSILSAFREAITPGGKTHLPRYKVREGLYLTPSVLELAGLDMILSSAMGREYILKRLLDEVRGDFDFILLDTPPSLGIIVYNSLIAADEVLVPLTPETLPYMGLTTIENLCETISSSLSLSVGITGVFFTRVEKGSLQSIVMDEVKKKYGKRVFSTLIRKNISVAQAPLAGESLFDYAPKSNAAEDYRRLSEEIVKRTKNSKK